MPGQQGGSGSDGMFPVLTVVMVTELYAFELYTKKSEFYCVYLETCLTIKKEKSRPVAVAYYACITSTLGGQRGQIIRSRVQNQPGQYGETPSLLKIQKLARRGGMHP